MLWGLVLLHLCARSLAAADLQFDVIVYGASPAGIAAAITAANGTGLRVALIEPSPYVGGMAGPGGIGLRDTASPAEAVTGGPRSVMAAWLARVRARYPGSAVRQPDANVSMAAWDELVADPAYSLTVARGTALDEAPGAVVVAGGAIASIRTVDAATGGSATVWRARYFVDASYEADIVLGSGAISYTIGREPRDRYNESIAGVLPSPAFQRFRATVDPFWPNGSLLDGVEPSSAMPPAGAGDDRVMPSSYRCCITNDARLRAPWPRPEGYSEDTFELLIRLAQALPADTELGGLVGIYPYYGYPASPELPMKYGAWQGAPGTRVRRQPPLPSPSRAPPPPPLAPPRRPLREQRAQH